MAHKIEPACIANLLKLAKAYADHHELSMVTVGRYFHGTGTIFEELRKGERSILVSKYDNMVAQFRKKWPADLAWPKLREPFQPSRRPNGQATTESKAQNQSRD